MSKVQIQFHLIEKGILSLFKAGIMLVIGEKLLLVKISEGNPIVIQHKESNWI